MARLDRERYDETNDGVAERGQTFAEYAVMLGVVTVGIVAAMTALVGGVSALIDRVTGFFAG